MKVQTGIQLSLMLLSVLISFGSLVYTIWKNKKTDEIREKVEKVQLDTIQASALYENIKKAKRAFIDSMTELIIKVKDQGANNSEIETSFLNTYNRYTDFYNEINDYCIMIEIGGIKTNNYVNSTISKNFSMFAKLQVETYENLNEIAKSKGLKKLNKPTHNAFKEYDSFLKNKNGENSAFWTDLKTERARVGFE